MIEEQVDANDDGCKKDLGQMIWIIYYCLGPSQDQLFRGGLLSNIFTIIVTFPLRALIIIFRSVTTEL